MIDLPRLENGQLQANGWISGYPLYYVTQDGGTICPDCARGAESEGLTNDSDDPQWYIIAYQANYEDVTLHCDHCSNWIKSAYDPD